MMRMGVARDPSSFRPCRSLTAHSVVSNSSSRSLATTFSTLAADDVAFFDEVVASLSPGDASFASLKAVYERIRGRWPGISDGRDAHLWNCLLSLVKVRGRDWSERWDAVRIEIGFDLREADMTASSIVSEATAERESFPHALSLAVGSGLTRRDIPIQTTQQEWSQDTSQSEGSNADRSSASDEDKDDYWEQHKQSSATSSLTTVGAEAGQSTPPSSRTVSSTPSSSNARKSEFSDLQARIVNLTRQAGNLVLQAGGQSIAQTPRATGRAPASDGMGGLSARSSPPLQSGLHRRQGNVLLPPREQRDRGATETSPSALSDVLPLQLQQAPQQFPLGPRRDVLSVIRSTPGSLRDAVYRRAEESEEVAWEGSANYAQRHYELHLLAACFGWWCELHDRQTAREHKAKRFGLHGLLLRVLGHWKRSALIDRDREHMTARADAVRCQLSAWRKWRRLARTTRTQRWEGRKTEMRESYTVIKEKRQLREQDERWHRWRLRLLGKRSANFRSGHLLGGAFYLWRLKLDVAQRLGRQERKALASKQFALAKKVFDMWVIQMRLLVLLDRWQDEHAVQTLREPLTIWKKTASLTMMERAYSAHRLRRTGLQTWLQRLAEMGPRKRRQKQADCRLNKSIQSRAICRWNLAMQQARRRRLQAVQFKQASDYKTLKDALTIWRTEGRAQLFRKVRCEGLRKIYLAQWRTTYTRKVAELSEHAQKLSFSNSRRAVSAYLSHWRTMVRTQRELTAMATAIDARAVQAKVFQTWRSAKDQLLRRTEKAAAIEECSLLKRNFSFMRAKVRATKVHCFSDKRDARLLKRASSFWRGRATQQSIDRLGVAHIQSAISLRTEKQILQHWTQRVIERRSLLIEVGEAHNIRVALKAFHSWCLTRRRVEDLQRLGQSFRDVKIEEAIRRKFLSWSLRYRKALSLRDRAARFVTSKEESMRTQAFAVWYDNWRQMGLRALEYEVALQRQEDAKSRVLNVWMYRTASFPAIRLDHSRLKRLALRTWRKGVPGAMSRRLAVQQDNHSLSRKAFWHWIDSSKAQRAARAAARFGGQSMARLRRHSSRTQSPFITKARRSSGNGHQRSSSPVARGESDEGYRSFASVRRARSEALESERPSALTGTIRPRSEVSSASGGASAALQGSDDILSTSGGAGLPVMAEIDGTMGKVAAVVSRQPTSLQISSSRTPVRQADEQLHRLAVYRRTTPTFSSVTSDGGTDNRKSTVSLTSHDAHHGIASQRGSRGVGTGAAARSLPSLSVAASDGEAAGQAMRQTDALTQRPASLALSAYTPVAPFARTLREQRAHPTSSRRKTVERAPSVVSAHELHHPRSGSNFVEDLRRKRRAVMERQT
ncbi:hypothetical protein BCV69DRAFT_298845 [Microstroma glucosiphilum]|uniref:Sfi1 spindle body domain-containing protein n=1 Tax=Pseudomicrostroma glucosiphilum TaxID=1684307 RepID=A0A316UDB8_9BASI|nr:hypothetical protein BCV69DRAFT_298845 [Pseudomicrostroma glucosiphilum]PWN21055.1 hypothetical protein BCV69DRAFT_298845 [Pseudomicrostroma glucosiphilum]